MQVQTVQNLQNFKGNVYVIGSYGRASLEKIAKEVEKMNCVKKSKYDVFLKDFRQPFTDKSQNWTGVIAAKNTNRLKYIGLWQKVKTKNKKQIMDATEKALMNVDINAYLKSVSKKENTSLLQRLKNFFQ